MTRHTLTSGQRDGAWAHSHGGRSADPYVRRKVCDTLEELRRKVVAEAGTLKEAIGVARLAEFDPAILDLRLGDETTELVAEITRGRGLPFFLLTGHTSDGLPGGCRMLPDWKAGSMLRTREMIENCGRS